MPAETRGGSIFLINAAAFVVIVAGLRAADAIAVLLLVSIFFAVICSPAVIWLKRKRVPSIAAVLLVVVAVIGVFTVMGMLVGTSINRLCQSAALLQRPAERSGGSGAELAA